MSLASFGCAAPPRHRVCGFVTALAGLCLAGRAHAQGCIPDTSTVVKRLAVGLSVDRDLDATRRQLATTVAAAIASYVDAPTKLSMDKLRGPSEWKDATGSYQSEGLLSIGQLVMDLGPSGHLQRVALDPGTGSPEVDHAVLAGAAAADSGGVFPQAPSGAADAVRHVRLWLLTATAPAPNWAAPLFLVAGQVPANATPASVQSQTAPVYPQALLARRVEGDVYLAFDVDQAGRVPETSIRVLSADDSGFIEVAKQSIREGHYVAATQGGCAVNATLRQRVRFQPPPVTSLAATAPASDVASDPAGTTAQADLADEGGWLTANVPRLSGAQVLIEVPSHSIGATDIGSGRTWVTHVKLDRCTLTIDRVFETMGNDPALPMPKLRISHRIPLDHADPRSIYVQQTPGRGSLVGLVSGQPWRIVLNMSEGVIRSDRDWEARRSSTNDTDLDLIVTDRLAGLQIVPHLTNAITACH